MKLLLFLNYNPAGAIIKVIFFGPELEAYIVVVAALFVIEKVNPAAAALA